MSDADIARQSNDGDGYVIIAGEGDSGLEIEVQEEILAEKVGSNEDSPVKEKVDLDEIADIFNKEEDGEPTENGVEAEEPEGDLVAEEEIAEVKVGSVEVGLSVQLLAEEEEKETDKTEEKEEEKEEEEEKVEEEKVEEEQEVEEEEKERVEERIEERIEDRIEQDVEEHKEDHEEEQQTESEEKITIEENGDLVNISIASKDEPAEENVSIEINLGDKEEEVEEKEEDAEPEAEVDQKDQVSHVVRPAHSSSLPLSDRIRVFEKKEKENDPFQPETKRSNNKLENSKFTKYQKSVDDYDDESPKSGGSGSKRLDMSKFALFQTKSEDKTDGSPPKKNFTIKPAVNKTRYGSQGQSSNDSSNKCLVCEKRVYPMERVAADGKVYHKGCFRCAECKKVLSLGNFAQMNSMLFCKPHFTQRFKLHGNYDTGFSSTSLRNASSAEEYILNAGDKASDEIAATEAQTTESTPVVRDDIVKSYDYVEEEKSLPGGTKSIREQFSKGIVSNVEIKRTIDSEPVNVKSLEDYHPPQDEEDEEVHIKPQDISSTDQDEGQTAESQPQEIPEGVVRSNDGAEEVRTAAGLKDLKSMFEKGGVSNIHKKVEREKIEVKALGEVDDGPPQGVAENVPKERQADVLSAASYVDEDPGIKHGLAQRIKAQFEKGSVSNIEGNRKPDLERTPKSLEDFSQDETDKSVSESTPRRRDDVIRSDIPLEEQSHTAEGTRSLLTRWEKGEVEHAEEKPKEIIRDSKDMKADMQVSESQPAVRDDLIRESDETDNDAIPEGVTRGISQTIEEGSAEFHVEVNVSLDEPKRLVEEEGEQEEAQFQVNVEVNGNVTPEENGQEDEATPNGHYQNDDESADVDPSAEIKAARASAVEEEDSEKPDVLVESR